MRAVVASGGQSEIRNPKSEIDAPSGRAYWRNLEEYADSPAFRAALADEFAGYDPDELRSMSRRKFMMLAGASMALAGLTLTGCRRWPKEQVLPYAARPEGQVPGVPEHFASMFEHLGVATPIVVKTFDGRPIKIDGNADGGGSGLTPYLKGKTTIFDQAQTLTFYDPQRARGVLHDGESATWQDFASFVSGHPTFQQAGGDKGLAVLAEPTSSPTIARLRAAFEKKYPGAGWYTYAPINRDNQLAGAALAFGKPVRAMYDLTRADVIVALDCDLFHERPDSPRLAHDWAAGRRSADTDGRMNRLYAIESAFTPTGSAADHRLPVKSTDIARIAFAIAAKVGLSGAAFEGGLNGSASFVDALAEDLVAHAGRAVLIPGEAQPAQVHALCHAINTALGATQTGVVSFIDEPTETTPSNPSVTDLAGRLAAGQIDTLLVLGGNPAYDAPADLDFATALAKAPHVVRLGLYHDETSQGAAWSLPMAHALECWGDGRAWDGTLSIQQPMIVPLFEDAGRTTGGRAAAEVLAMILGEEVQKYQDGYSLVRQTHAALDDSAWRTALHNGVVPATQAEPAAVRLAGLPAAPAAVSGEFEVTLAPDPCLHDGRYANNGWLQEAPKPMSKVTWDNAATISIADAKALGVNNGDHLAVTVGGATLDLPAFIMPGQAVGSIALTLGYGRTHAGYVGDNVGFNTYALRTTTAPSIAPATVAKAGGHTRLATTAAHHLIDPDKVNGKLNGTDYPAAWALAARTGKPNQSGKLIHEATLDVYKKKGSHAFGEHSADLRLQLYPGPGDLGEDGFRARAKKLAGEAEDAPEGWSPPTAFNDPHAWGMTIDMNTCIGCNACVIACQAENNIPVVGKSMVAMSREMHWLRIDTYFKGKPDSPDVQAVHQPVACVHCENAPCEQVCPVAATVHDSEGLNTMVYNRCIGTRYCSNNCPYKVRRFNYYDFHAKDVRGGKSAKPWLNIPDTQQDGAIDKITRMVFNPDVTVRMRGVMEKCTYCVQRITAAKIKAKADWARAQSGVAGHDRDTPNVKDGEVRTACQDACATDAIQFGDLNDPNSRVSREYRNDRTYQLLEVLNPRPRTRHMARIRNPNPKLKA